MAMQQEVKIEKNNQNILIQKISNLLETGEDKISYKKAIEKINKKQLDEIGTDRSREKPINIIRKNIEINEQKIKELKDYENIQYEIDEQEKIIKNKLEKKEIKNNLLKEIKINKEKNNIENEKIKIKENIIEENKNKIKEIENKLEKINNKIIEEKNSEKYFDKKYEKNKLNKKIIIIFLILFLLNILWLIFIPKIINNKIIKYIFLLTAPMFLIFYIFLRNKLNKKIKILENNQKEIIEKIKNEKNNIENEENIYQKNIEELNNEINKIKSENNMQNNLEEYKIINKYEKNIEKNEINFLLKKENLNIDINIVENEINDLRYELNKLEVKKENIVPQLENLSSIEEQTILLKQQLENLEQKNESIELVKVLLSRAYENMKNSVSPVFTEKLSKNIANITKGKYCKLNFSDENGLIVELENGNYIPAERLSIGTIDQLYLSLRLAMLDEVSNEKVPIILDEAFAFFDNERLKNILLYLSEEFKNRQIIILTCTNREKEILNNENINYNYVEL